MSDEMTPAKIRRANKKAGLDQLQVLIEQGKPVPVSELQDIYAKMRPGRAAAQSQGLQDFIKKLRDQKTVSEQELFETMHIGRPEARRLIRQAVNKAPEPSKRVWILFDEEKKVYLYVNQGTNPKWDGDYPGFIPRDMK